MEPSIIQSLYDWNPWLEGEFPEKLAGYPRDYNIDSYMALEEIKILTGARRVGKSTLLYQVIKKLLQEDTQILYINFQDEVLRKKTLSEIYYNYQEIAEIKYLFIDEVQYCQEWVHFVRTLYDRKELDQIWLSNSNASLLKKEYAELLTGRNIAITINTLSFSEYLNFKNVSPVQFPMSQKKQIEIKRHFNDYLKFGAFPAIALRSVYQKELLQNYFEDFIYKDIAARYDVNTTKIKELGIYLASNSTKIFSYRKVAEALGIHSKTVIDYLSYLKEIFLFDELHKFDYSLKNQYGHDKKIYMIDTGLAAAIAFKFSEDAGRMLENLVYSELKRRGLAIYFHKKTNECDFIIKSGYQITQAIQVCQSLANPQTAKREIAGLVEAMQTYDLKEGLILTQDEEGEQKIEKEKTYRISIKPIWKWMLE